MLILPIALYGITTWYRSADLTSWSTGPSRSTGRFRYTSNFHIQDWSSSADTIMAEARTQEELTAELDDLRKKLDTFEAAQRQQAAATLMFMIPNFYLLA